MSSDTYPGIGRAAYFGASLAILTGSLLVGVSNSDHYWESPATVILFIAHIPLSIAFLAMRFINIGNDPWLAAGYLLPLVSPILVVYCLVMPTGYRQHKQMDTLGGTLITAIGAFIAVAVALLIFG